MFSLLVVDVSEDWEEALKAHERGYFIDWEPYMPGKYVPGRIQPSDVSLISYPHGSLRAGFNAIIDTVRMANRFGAATYAVEHDVPNADGEEETCWSLRPYVDARNRYHKRSLSAFGCEVANHLRPEDGPLFILGYDRDACVLATVKDAVERGFRVVLSEHCLLTADRNNRREDTMAYFRANTHVLDSLIDVWNWMRDRTCVPA